MLKPESTHNRCFFYSTDIAGCECCSFLAIAVFACGPTSSACWWSMCKSVSPLELHLSGTDLEDGHGLSGSWIPLPYPPTSSQYQCDMLTPCEFVQAQEVLWQVQSTTCPGQIRLAHGTFFRIRGTQVRAVTFVASPNLQNILCTAGGHLNHNLESSHSSSLELSA